MNKKPVSYLQTDARWKNKPYRVSGETSTIGSAGCGPTSASMLIETITGKTFTPEDACKWSVEHGFKALNQGTYYAYFKPQFDAFGIDCDILNWTNTYGKPNHENHKKAFDLLKQGYYLIALMNKGLWTSSGHFIVVWWEDGKVRINDPASTKESRLNGDPITFKSQVKYYWWVDARKYNESGNSTSGSTISAPTSPLQSIKTGDIVSFTGTKHYSSSNGINGKVCKPGKAKVTAIAKSGKHPYHLMRTIDGGSTVYGWVDAKDISSAYGIQKGSKVKVLQPITYSGSSFKVYYDAYDVLSVDGDRVVIGIGKTVTAAVNVKNLQAL